jgi:alpha-D-ribose 1-methylphosphonate 5-triphosphate synthase subunit PhnH
MSVPTLTSRALTEQQTFRALLDAMARPGSIGRVPLHDHGGAFAAAIKMLETLLDHEVTFAVAPERADLVDIILRQTGSHSVALESAGYVLCDGPSLAAALTRANPGDLEYPDRSATIISLVDSVSELAGAGTCLRLSGPGIKETRDVWFDGFTAEALTALQNANAFPPLGIDLVFVAPDGGFFCLSRYTKLREVR